MSLLSKIKSNSKFEVFFLLVFAVFVSILLYINPSSFNPFFTRGEAREGQVVKSIYEFGNYVLPLRNQVEIPSKPPLFHWLGSIFAQCLGSLSEFAVRLPSAVGALLINVFITLFIYRRLGLSSAILGLLIQATSLEVLLSSNSARVDTVFAATLIGCFIGVVNFFEDFTQGKTNRNAILLISFSSLLATLCKGPSGIVIPWFIFGCSFLVLVLRNFSFSNLKENLSKLPLKLIAISIFSQILLASLWYYSAYLIGGTKFLDIHLMRENLARISGSDDYQTGHHKPFYYGLVLLFQSFLPWTLFLPLAIVQLAKTFFKGDKNQALTISLIWLSTFLLIISVVASKRSVYFLPASFAFTYVLSDSINSIINREFIYPKYYKTCAVLLSLFSLFLIIVGSNFYFYKSIDTSFLESVLAKVKNSDDILVILQGIQPNIGLWLLLCLACASLFFAAFKLFKLNLEAALFFVGISFITLSLSASYEIIPQVANLSSVKSFVQTFNDELKSTETLYQYNEDYFPVSFYSNKTVNIISNVESLVGTSYIFVTEGKFPDLQAKLQQANINFSIYKESSKIALYGKEKLLLLKVS